jgi:glycosyltransferase involved in cell wall biosynthesis
MTSGNKRPLVSIGVFLYNEERFIRETLTSLLAQDYPYLEIVISDNCSTDNTDAVCRELAAGDQRVRYERHERNIGATANFIHVLERATGEYFMWASGHDLWSPNLVSECVAALEARPDAALAYASSSWIDEQGRPLSRESGWYDTRGSDAIVRFFMAFWGNLHPILGLIRAVYLRELPKIHACAGADQIVLAELALKGDFLHVAGASWWRRQPRAKESHRDRMQRYTSDEFGLATSWLDRRLPLLRLPLEQLRAVARSRMNFAEKLAVLIALPPTFIVRYLAGRKS